MHSTTEMYDQTLSTDHRSGGSSGPEGDLSLERLYQIHAGTLCARALFLTRNEADAWDLLQETLERGLRTPRGKVPPAKMRGWLLVIMHNLFLDQRRSYERRWRVTLTDQLLANLSSPLDEPEPAWASFDATVVLRALPQLPECMRRTFELYVDGRSYADIAATLEVPTRTVGSRIHRARRRLRELLAGTDSLA